MLVSDEHSRYIQRATQTYRQTQTQTHTYTPKDTQAASDKKIISEMESYSSQTHTNAHIWYEIIH